MIFFRVRNLIEGARIPLLQSAFPGSVNSEAQKSPFLCATSADPQKYVEK